MIEKAIDKIHEYLDQFFKKIFKKDLCKETFTQFIKHYMVGFLGIAINYILFNYLMYLGFGIKISNLYTYIVLTITIFFLQKYFTYPGNAQ